MAVVPLTAASALAAPVLPDRITVASTTSTENSGLFEYLLPRFTAESGVEVRVVAVGTGQALRLARNGDADVLLVHHEASERRFVADGYGVERHALMHNDFVLVGPSSDPASVAGLADAAAAMARLAAGGHAFVSRGDDSGTHRKEQSLWQAAGVAPQAASGRWYREAGAGMGATLNTASAMNAYTLTDRATWLRFGNKGDLALLVQGDERLFNPYGVILVNPGRHNHVNAVAGQRFVDWLLSPRGQRAIAAFCHDGRPLFFPERGDGFGGDAAAGACGPPGVSGRGSDGDTGSAWSGAVGER